MALHKGLLKRGFKLPECEKHFHDHDETWIIVSGTGTSYWIDQEGHREDFVLEENDIWMIPAGFEHGSDGPNSEDFQISVFNGTQPPGSHQPGHYYMEQEAYIPTLKLVKESTSRYRQHASRPEMIKGVMFIEKGKAVLQEEKFPHLQSGHILCKTIYSGVTNGTERNVLMGGNYGGKWPNRCGYQNVGRVIEVPRSVKAYTRGDLIFSGMFSQHVEYFSVNVSEPESESNWVIKLPGTINTQEAALFGMASVAMHDVRRAEIRLGEKVLVIGAGSIGLFTSQIARASGAQVTICDLKKHRLGIAQELGIQQTIQIQDENSWEKLARMGPFDAVFEDSGADVLDKILGEGFGQKRLLTTRGRLVLIAGRNEVIYKFNAGQGAELSALHASHFQRTDLKEVCRLVSEGILKVRPIIQNLMPISEAPSFYDRLRDDPGSTLGTVFVWEEK
ncbi:MAG: zinc-binding dehydrogenase [Planctomycetota bacterium]|nr:zinc-binding dehydrogenase [Planctomycetota bacterium]